MFLQDDALLPSKQEINVPARSTIVAPSQSSSDYIVDAHQVRPGLYVGRTLLPATHRNLRIRMVNTTSSPQFLPSGTCVGSLSPVDVVDDTPLAKIRMMVEPSRKSRLLLIKHPQQMTRML